MGLNKLSLKEILEHENYQRFNALLRSIGCQIIDNQHLLPSTKVAYIEMIGYGEPLYVIKIFQILTYEIKRILEEMQEEYENSLDEDVHSEAYLNQMYTVLTNLKTAVRREKIKEALS
jgi:uncharacterized protein YeeX (DUF496 family)